MDSKVLETNQPNSSASIASNHKPTTMLGVGKHQSTCLPSARARAACGRQDTPGQKNPSKLLLLDVCWFVTAETRRAKGLVLKERRGMPEPGCCQLTCHSLHAAPGLAGWGEAGAGEPARPQSRGRGSERVGSCLSQTPCSRSAGWYLAGESTRHFQPRMYFPPLPMTFMEGLAVVSVGRLSRIGITQ